MGNPCFYVVPLDGEGVEASLEKVTFPDLKGVEILEVFPVRARLDCQPSEGTASFLHYGVTEQVTIKVGNLTIAQHANFIARLAAMDSALQMGSRCHFTMDRGKSGAWPVTFSSGLSYYWPSQGDLTMERTTNDCLAIETSPVLVAGDVAVVETSPPESHQHYGVLADFGVGAYPDITYAADNGVFWDTTAPYSYIRWRDFLPGLYLSQASLGEPRLRRVGPLQWEYQATFLRNMRFVFDRFPEDP